MGAITAAAVAALLGAVTLTGCSGGDTDAKPKPTKTATPSPSEEPTPSPSPTGPVIIGDTWEWEGKDDKGAYSGTTTVLSYEQHVARTSIQPEEEFGPESKGYVWAALELKVCTTTGDVYVDNTPWTLAYEDGARIQPSTVTYGDFPKPEYPAVPTIVKPSDCVRGKIVFSVPSDQRPEKVVYAPSDGDVTEWAVPKK